MTSKLAPGSNFASDAPFLRSVRPKIGVSRKIWERKFVFVKLWRLIDGPLKRPIDQTLRFRLVRSTLSKKFWALSRPKFFSFFFLVRSTLVRSTLDGRNLAETSPKPHRICAETSPKKLSWVSLQLNLQGGYKIEMATYLGNNQKHHFLEIM